MGTIARYGFDNSFTSACNGDSTLSGSTVTLDGCVSRGNTIITGQTPAIVSSQRSPVIAETETSLTASG